MNTRFGFLKRLASTPAIAALVGAAGFAGGPAALDLTLKEGVPLSEATLGRLAPGTSLAPEPITDWYEIWVGRFDEVGGMIFKDLEIGASAGYKKLAIGDLRQLVHELLGKENRAITYWDRIELRHPNTGQVAFQAAMRPGEIPRGWTSLEYEGWVGAKSTVSTASGLSPLPEGIPF